MLPGLMTLPIYSLLPCVRGKGVPLSMPTEEAKSAGRGVAMIGVVVIAMILSAMAMLAWAGAWFWWLVGGEAVLVGIIYLALYRSLASARWSPME